MPLPCSASFRTNSSIRGREYGGLSHTRPSRFRDSPSMFRSYMTSAVGHSGRTGAQGSRSNLPNASNISLGVYHSSDEWADFSNRVFIGTVLLQLIRFIFPHFYSLQPFVPLPQHRILHLRCRARRVAVMVCYRETVDIPYETSDSEPENDD